MVRLLSCLSLPLCHAALCCGDCHTVPTVPIALNSSFSNLVTAPSIEHDLTLLSVLPSQPHQRRLPQTGPERGGSSWAASAFPVPSNPVPPHTIYLLYWLKMLHFHVRYSRAEAFSFIFTLSAPSTVPVWVSVGGNLRYWWRGHDALRVQPRVRGAPHSGRAVTQALQLHVTIPRVSGLSCMEMTCGGSCSPGRRPSTKTEPQSGSTKLSFSKCHHREISPPLSLNCASKPGWTDTDYWLKHT